MNRDEFLDLENGEMAELMNKELEAGKSREEVEAIWDLTAADLKTQNIFFVKGKYLARAWSGYTSTKRSGNEFKEAEGGGWRNDAKDFKGQSF